MEGMLYASTQTFYERMLEHYTYDRHETLPKLYEDMRREHEEDQRYSRVMRPRRRKRGLFARRSMQYEPVSTDSRCHSV